MTSREFVDAEGPAVELAELVEGLGLPSRPRRG